jgi:hypothetical protein
MLIPRFSISWILGLMAACAIFFFVVSLAFDGSVVAMAIAGGVVVASVCFILFAIVFLLVYGLSGLMKSLRPAAEIKTPFAEPGELPPQPVPQSSFEPAQ